MNSLVVGSKKPRVLVLPVGGIGPFLDMLHMAVVFLQSTTLSIGEVAEKVGMPDIKHFSKCFKKIIGHSPSQFRVK